jgi:hypothetical protein
MVSRELLEELGLKFFFFFFFFFFTEIYILIFYHKGNVNKFVVYLFYFDALR